MEVVTPWCSFWHSPGLQPQPVAFLSVLFKAHVILSHGNTIKLLLAISNPKISLKSSSNGKMYELICK